MMTKSERRKLRKARAASGQPWNIEMNKCGHPEPVRERTPREERRHQRAGHRWAKRYSELNGAPEGDSDR